MARLPLPGRELTAGELAPIEPPVAAPANMGAPVSTSAIPDAPLSAPPIPDGVQPYDWDPVTGIARRFVPGQPNGMHTLTGLAHDRNSKVAYDPEINEEGLRARSLKIAALQKTLKTPPVFGGPEGDLLVVGWGSNKGVIEEAVERMRDEGCKVSSLHLTFIQPMPSGIREILKRFKRVMTIEGNWSDSLKDELIDADNRRYSALAMMLRSRYLVDVDCWSEARGQPIKPGSVVDVALAKLKKSPTKKNKVMEAR